jgi:hypothetical protein
MTDLTAQSPAPQRLYVRFSQAADDQRIKGFYQSHIERHKDRVAMRDPDLWAERAAAGAITIIEDESEKIVATSIAYQVKKDGVHSHTEVGSVLVEDQKQGIGLFRILGSAQFLQSYMLETPAEHFLIEITKTNSDSRSAFAKLGAKPFDIPEDLRRTASGTLDDSWGSVAIDWFRMDSQDMPSLARNLFDAESGGVVLQAKTNDRFVFDFSKCSLMTSFRAATESLAKGDVRAPEQISRTSLAAGIPMTVPNAGNAGLSAGLGA